MNNIAQGEANQIIDIIVDWSANQTIEKFHIQLFDMPLVMLIGIHENANIFMIRRLI